MSDELPILRPRPQRVFNLTDSSESSTPPEPANSDTLNPKESGSASISRNVSIMNLTSPTLFGIYSPTAFESTRDEYSPWGTEAHTPNPESRKVQPTSTRSESAAVRRTRTRLSHGLFRGVILPQALKSALLLGFGVIYGIITIHLHENHWITPVKLEYTHFYGSWQYLGFWGIIGVTLGNLLPWLDSFLEKAAAKSAKEDKRPSSEQDATELNLSWASVVRSVGAFVGIAFAMRRTPWESTTQASATLALVNPVLWYLIDRTKTGFLLSTILGVGGMGLLLGLKPDLIPPSTEPVASTMPFLNGTGLESTFGAGVTQESLAVRIWVASVLFCACVCFGNIGRQLAIGGREPLKS
ncbi:hypothetical protein P175DRAFT_0429176 [Aspergillus ochraceoroseus IBT 24754]|uniref:INSIG domain protein n=3 Tax=Aspergillus subgen. Nidulantes TaxID=2720870 RepID=A0A0F8WSP6_9EURO|nr:uncharacterized protein P175DRAFT_0429176 [Aspergillus ochraceoroseus IBT 24754]KKK19873.1 hypothetical protein AOCH_003541 [Aspergillus ochraceoroseus]KKK20655.1 hypothetical protein ARAM_000312 [Aspergillus rambellii]PTU24966.1 hypothetical protein P175DRAFT_0429176 [Aspergillus ochraceoroseus IBT 24754]